MTTQIQQRRLSHAIAFAAAAHRDQYRRGGEPYILHPLAVMNALAREDHDESVLIVAVLHDVLEDTDAYFSEDLAVMPTIHIDGNPGVDYAFALTPDEAVALRALTHNALDSYGAYIERIVESGDIAVVVKVADIEHNLRDKPRAGKARLYRHALARLLTWQQDFHPMTRERVEAFWAEVEQ